MNKKVRKEEAINDIQEDLEIKNIAHKKVSQYFLLLILIVIFGVTLFSSLFYIFDYYNKKNTKDYNTEIIEINNNKNSVLIVNTGDISQNVSDINSEKEEYVIEKIDSIILSTNSDSDSDGKITFDIKYEILENNFLNNAVSKNDSDLLVRFSYSYDNENWNYVNNVISTTESTINPLMGNYYDIAGFVTNLKVKTNYELTSKPGETVKMYWKSETIILNKEENKDNKITAKFKIDYKSNV